MTPTHAMQSRLGTAFDELNYQDLASKLDETASPICNSELSLLFFQILPLGLPLFKGTVA
jgi:hypothetical protein